MRVHQPVVASLLLGFFMSTTGACQRFPVGASSLQTFLFRHCWKAKPFSFFRRRRFQSLNFGLQIFCAIKPDLACFQRLWVCGDWISKICSFEFCDLLNSRNHIFIRFEKRFSASLLMLDPKPTSSAEEIYKVHFVNPDRTILAHQSMKIHPEL